MSNVFAAQGVQVRLTFPTSAGGASWSSANIQAYQVLAVPVEVNPGYVRHTGLNTANRNIPRALLPAAMSGGVVRLAELRDPTQPENAAAHPNGHSVLLWIDLHVPAGAQPGDYSGACELLNGDGAVAGAPLPIKLHVYDFALPDERHLHLAGELRWSRLAALYPDLFGDTITPSLINRRDPRYQRTVRVLDQMMVLAERERTSLFVPGLRPTVKWPAGEPPQVDWREFDGLVAPWMDGQAFADHMPLPYWAVPSAPGLARYDAPSRAAYWSVAAAHFDQLGWLPRSAVLLHNAASASAEAPASLAADAARLLEANPHLSVMVPLEDEQVAGTPALAPAADADRLLTAAAPLISEAPASPWTGAGSTHHPHWLRTEMPGLVPYAGAGGDERDVRGWAWLAFLRRADLVLWNQALPSTAGPNEPADPAAMVWFYPGQWFGVDEPLPTVQLKWLRRAEQDFEYLWLARQRGQVASALLMARLLTKPVEILPGQPADPAFAMMSGTTNASAWAAAQDLLARTILLRNAQRPDGADVQRNADAQRALDIEMLQWAQPQERPLLMPRSAAWSMEGPRRDPAGGPTRGNWASLTLGVEIYNASDLTPDKNALHWSPPSPESAWEVRPQPVEVPQLQRFHIQPATLQARLNLDELAPATRSPMELSFVNGFTRVATTLKVRLPVAASDRREGAIALNGRLDDWTDADALQDGPLVLMLNRPDLQAQRLASAAVPAKVYSTWGRDHFYLAFSLAGLSPDPHQAHNDVEYQARRAWNEDLAEILIQPIYADNALGPVLHVVCKPNGAQWVERKLPSEASHGPEEWNAIEGTGVRYATTTTTDGRWHGEVGIPWRAINAGDHDRPIMLRFNFAQHRQSNCESASWCGPVDFGRDDRLMGLLYLRTPRDVGLSNTARQDDDPGD